MRWDQSTFLLPPSFLLLCCAYTYSRRSFHCIVWPEGRKSSAARTHYPFFLPGRTFPLQHSLRIGWTQTLLRNRAKEKRGLTFTLSAEEEVGWDGWVHLPLLDGRSPLSSPDDSRRDCPLSVPRKKRALLLLPKVRLSPPS